MPEATKQAPQEPIGRKPLSKRRRQGYAVALGLAIAVVIGVAIGVAVSSPSNEPRATPTAPGDEDAPPGLVKAADEVGYSPPDTGGLGTTEGAPASAAPTPSNKDLLPVGSTAPPFTLPTPAGEMVSLADFKGKTVLLEIFAAWCPHCAAEAPHLRELANSMSPSKYAFVSIDGSGEDAATVFAYHRYFGLPYPALLDLDPSVAAARFPNHGSPGPVSRAYNTGYFPTFYVIDPQGKIAWASDGEQPDALLRQELQRASGG